MEVNLQRLLSKLQLLFANSAPSPPHPCLGPRCKKELGLAAQRPTECVFTRPVHFTVQLLLTRGQTPVTGRSCRDLIPVCEVSAHVLQLPLRLQMSLVTKADDAEVNAVECGKAPPGRRRWPGASFKERCAPPSKTSSRVFCLIVSLVTQNKASTPGQWRN